MLQGLGSGDRCKLRFTATFALGACLLLAASGCGSSGNSSTHSTGGTSSQDAQVDSGGSIGQDSGGGSGGSAGFDSGGGSGGSIGQDSGGGSGGSAGKDSGGGSGGSDSGSDAPAPCASDADCAGSPLGGVCDVSSGDCVACLPSDDACPLGQYCTATNTCTTGCKSSNDCTPATDGGSEAGDAATAEGGPELFCNPNTHQCVGCVTDDDCPPGSVCNASSVCVAGCTAQHACASGQSCCSSSCVDEQNDVNNCGGCDNACTSISNGTVACHDGACAVGACDPGFADCDANPANGCETNISTSPTNCGACGMVCLLPNATPACSSGNCTIVQCSAGFANCDGQDANGCEVNTQTDPNNCGACGHICSIANGTAACVAGVCAVATCNAGWSDCDNNPANGCEAHTGADVNNCGTCGHVCSVANGTPACTGGTCAVGACNSGYANCDNNPANGCEVNTQTDPNNCGACSHLCSVANGTPGCSSGLCTVASCNSGFADCNHTTVDGCETNTTTDVNNCGACGNACATACTGNVAATTCTASACQITACTAGHYNIDGACADGCECTPTGTSATCTSPSSLGTLAVGTSTTYTGNLVPTGQQAYLTVTFTGNTNLNYHPQVTLTAGAGEFAFDIFSNCSGTTLACGTEGGVSIGRSAWEVYYTAGGSGSPFFVPIPPVGNNGTVIIHVYRLAGKPVTCNNYTLQVSN
jgi:hypothetical protein